jgi:hydroxyacylglutathione hydrolase
LLNVKQFRYGADNLGYLVYGRKDVLVIDGGAYMEMLNFIERRKLNLRFIANTHNHYDHTAGNSNFLNRPGVRILRYEELVREKEIPMEGQKIKIHNTPGHTEDSVCFCVGDKLITGDTLFNGTIGNCFTGDPAGFFQTIRNLMMLPAGTIVYAGHDYVKDAMLFAGNLEPGNANIDLFLSKYNPDHVFSTLEDEFRVNPYMRFNDVRICRHSQRERTSTWNRMGALAVLDVD